MLAAQREDGFAVRFQFAARSARWFVFGLWLQIHFCSGFSAPIIPSDVCANFAENLRNAAPGGESL
jgi:hypothetical protein